MFRMPPINQYRWSAEETTIAVSAEIATTSSKNAYEIARSNLDREILEDCHDHFRRECRLTLLSGTGEQSDYETVVCHSKRHTKGSKSWCEERILGC